MSPTTMRLIGKHATLRQNIFHHQNLARDPTKVVWRSLIEDYRRRAEKAASEIGVCLEPAMGNTDLHGAYTLLKRWYQ